MHNGVPCIPSHTTPSLSATVTRWLAREGQGGEQERRREREREGKSTRRNNSLSAMAAFLIASLTSVMDSGTGVSVIGIFFTFRKSVCLC